MSAEDLLKSVPLFSGLDRRHLSSVAKLAHERSYGAGDAIVTEGDQGIGLYVIVSGRVNIKQNNQGSEIDLGTMGPGEVFGELALLTNEARQATVRAAEPTTCLVVTAMTFDEMLDASPEVGKTLARTLAKRLVEVEERSRLS